MFWGLILTFVEVTGEPLVGGPFCTPRYPSPPTPLPPILNRINGSHQSEYLLKMDSASDFSQYPKASYLSRKGLHHRRLCSKT